MSEALFILRYTKRQITALTFFAITKTIKKLPGKAGFCEFKGQIVSKFDLGLLNAYNPMYFDRNISKNEDGKSYVTNGEFYFNKCILCVLALQFWMMFCKSYPQ